MAGDARQWLIAFPSGSAAPGSRSTIAPVGVRSAYRCKVATYSTWTAPNPSEELLWPPRACCLISVRRQPDVGSGARPRPFTPRNPTYVPRLPCVRSGTLLASCVKTGLRQSSNAALTTAARLAAIDREDGIVDAQPCAPVPGREHPISLAPVRSTGWLVRSSTRRGCPVLPHGSRPTTIRRSGAALVAPVAMGHSCEPGAHQRSLALLVRHSRLGWHPESPTA